jgi:hypothetical protein
MTGRDKILAAFTPGGAPDIGVVAAYEEIFIRDHYAALTNVPWGQATAANVLAQDCAAATGLEWISVHPCASREARARQRYEPRADGVWLIDDGTGTATRLDAPAPGGVDTSCARSRHTDPEALPSRPTDIDALIPLDPVFDRGAFLAEGRQDVAASVRAAVDLLLYSTVLSPLWLLYDLFGYEGMMILLGQSPDLALRAGQRLLDNVRQRIRMIAALGADAVWIEECFTDQISPELFRRINVPLVRRCVQEIRACGMKSIYYYCGNPHDRLEAILDAGADAVHFEESKKGFAIDIADIVRTVRGRCVVFGNLDAIGLLPMGSVDGLRSEIRRQLDAGRQNGHRFVMSTGSPITPDTPVDRVRLYTDLTRTLGGGR